MKYTPLWFPLMILLSGIYVIVLSIPLRFILLPASNTDLLQVIECFFTNNADRMTSGSQWPILFSLSHGYLSKLFNLQWKLTVVKSILLFFSESHVVERSLKFFVRGVSWSFPIFVCASSTATIIALPSYGIMHSLDFHMIFKISCQYLSTKSQIGVIFTKGSVNIFPFWMCFVISYPLLDNYPS